MTKFPTQNKILYQTGNISHDSYSVMAGAAGGGDLNLPKDLSLLNRRGYASTTRKGVPLVYRCKVDFYLHDEDGQGPSIAQASDLQATLKLNGVANNWVVRNAAVKWHAARDNMWKKAGISKRELGAYAHAIRYCYDNASDSWMDPIDGNGDGFAGGTWDTTTMVDMVDNEYKLGLIGDGVDEDAAHSVALVSMAHAYLASRMQVPADSNQEASETPAQFSHLEQLLRPTNLESGTEESYIRTDVMQDQDAPPYQLFATETLDHDITQPVELGRAIAGFGNSYGSMIVDIPFGIGQFKAVVFRATDPDPDTTPKGLVCLEVLDIYEMQG